MIEIGSIRDQRERGGEREIES
ncbi:hypothetical protein C5167_018052 [Papaver somniferum]|uniref:Uncharacterized protein n=1 Tax=Papaver somniferum TaxID=3469 RepID=A0A4Y7IQ76_PAPSO|nr:hypothetical protein C5167_018052 [Papaver somniferum]